MKSICVKVSESGKTMLVGHKTDKYQIGYKFAWAANPDKLEVSDDEKNPTEVKDFNPTGTEQCVNEDGEPILHKDGTPVLRWTF